MRETRAAYARTYARGSLQTRHAPPQIPAKSALTASGNPALGAFTNPFSDVADTAYYYHAVLWAKKTGIIAGTGNTTFSPDKPITREEAVTMLWRMAGKPIVSISNPFSDVDSSMWSYHAIMWAYSKGITNGTSSTTFSPKANCLRYQIAVFLNKYNRIFKLV